MEFGIKRPPKNILIYRMGSIGDTIVALPCFKLIASPEKMRPRCFCNRPAVYASEIDTADVATSYRRC
jgi:hypothetical protein